jgi:hypothetical protein
LNLDRALASPKLPDGASKKDRTTTVRGDDE